MTDDGDLRARLARVDPARQPELARTIESPTAQQIRERIMQTMDQGTEPTTAAPARRRWLITLGAAASVLVIVAAIAVVNRDGSSSKPGGGSTLALKAPASGGGVSMGSCVAFDVAMLRQMPVAFGGTVTDVSPGTVTIDVDRWYKGGSADTVTVSTPDGTTSVALDGVEFTEGKRYLVTATDGSVNVCGFSGEATAELERSFDEAFAG